MHDALRFAGRARRVENEQQIFGTHRFRRALLRHLALETVPPVVASILHLGEHFVAHAAAAPHHDEHMLDGGAPFDRFVGVTLERHDLAATIAAVGGDQHLAAAIVDAIAQGLGREAPKHHRVYSADARTREHSEHGFRNHRQVDRHAITLLYAEMLQHVRREIHLAIHIPIRERAAITRFTLPDQCSFIATWAVNVPIDAIDADVQFTAVEPGGVRRCPLQNAVPRLAPGEFAGFTGPEVERVQGRIFLQARCVHARFGSKRSRGRKRAIFLQQNVDIRTHGAEFSRGTSLKGRAHAQEPRRRLQRCRQTCVASNRHRYYNSPMPADSPAARVSALVSAHVADDVSDAVHPPADAPVLAAMDLVRRFGARAAVAGVLLALEPGACLALFDPNGAGNTARRRVQRRVRDLPHVHRAAAAPDRTRTRGRAKPHKPLIS